MSEIIDEKIEKRLIKEVLDLLEKVEFEVRIWSLFGPCLDESLLVEPAEKELYSQVIACEERIYKRWMADRYPPYQMILEEIGDLCPAIDVFFTEVMVSCPEEDKRVNRCKILAKIRALGDLVANFTKLQG